MYIKSWVNNRVLVTGSSGFVGRHLVSFLQKKEAKVIEISRNVVNLIDKEDVFEVFDKYKPEVCFHLASEAIVETGQKEPYKTFYNNTVSTLNVLEASRIFGARRVIIASSTHVYGDAPLPYREDEPARPSRPYETSKTCADLIAQSYADQFGFSVLIPRFVNLYGPGDQNMTRIIPKTIKSIAENKSPSLWGGNATRDYLYIDDAISAYDLLGRMSDSDIESNRIFNFATGKTLSAENLIKKIIALSGKKITIDRITDVRTNELIKQEVDWSKAKRILQWAPTVDLDTGLKNTISWFADMVS